MNKLNQFTELLVQNLEVTKDFVRKNNNNIYVFKEDFLLELVESYNFSNMGFESSETIKEGYKFASPTFVEEDGSRITIGVKWHSPDLRLRSKGGNDADSSNAAHVWTAQISYEREGIKVPRHFKADYSNPPIGWVRNRHQTWTHIPIIRSDETHNILDVITNKKIKQQKEVVNSMKNNFNNLFDKSVRYYDGDVSQIYSETEKQSVLDSIKSIIAKDNVEKHDIEIFEQLYVILWHYGQPNLINELEIVSDEIKRIYFEVKNDFETV